MSFTQRQLDAQNMSTLRRACRGCAAQLQHYSKRKYLTDTTKKRIRQTLDLLAKTEANIAADYGEKYNLALKVDLTIYTKEEK